MLNYTQPKAFLDCGLKHHNMEVMDPSLCHVGTKDNKVVLYYGSEIIEDLDAVIPRIGASNTFLGPHWYDTLRA